MMTASKVVGYAVAVALGMCVLGMVAAAQEIEWERFYSQGDPLPVSGVYYSGRHIQRLSDGGYVVTSVTGSGRTAAVARFDGEGVRLWDRGVTANDTDVYGTQFGHEGEQVKILPRFSYERADGRIVLFGNEGGGDFSTRDYGQVYCLVLDGKTGKLLDTITGLEVGRLWNGTPVCQARDGRFLNAVTWMYSQNLDSLGALFLQFLTPAGRPAGQWQFLSVGEQDDKEIYHYPWRVIQMSDGGFVVYGVRAVVNGPATLFLLNIDSLGNKRWDAQTKPETLGQLSGAFFDMTSDGGFILLGTVSYEDATAERKRWRVMRLVKFSSEGDEEWSRDYESGWDYTTGRSVRQTPDGGYLLLGTVGGFNESYSTYLSSQEDGFLLKTDGEGREEWRKQWGDTARDDMWYMELGADGCVIVTGSATRDTVWNGLYLAKIRLGTSGVGEEKESGETLRVLPNPARDRLRVVVSSPLIGVGMEAHLYDLLGRDVLGRSSPFGPSGVAEIDVSGLPAGTYRAVVSGAAGRPVVARSVVIVR